MAHWHRMQEEHDDSALTMNADLSTALVGVVMSLFLIALCALGAPEIKASEHETLKKNFELAKKLFQAAQESVDVAQSSFIRVMGERDAARAELKKVKGEGKLDPLPLDVVIAIDGSESMQPWMDKARTSIESMAEVCARIAPRFRLGIVVYRRGAFDSTVFDLQVIVATEKGVRSAGMKTLLSFCNDKTEVRTIVSGAVGELGGTATGETKYEPKLSGYLTPVNPELGVRKALSMFNDASARKVLVLISDVGPWEIDDPDKISAMEHAAASTLRELAAGFSGPSARVLALFTGSSAAALTHRKETEAFFRSLADAAGEAGTYSDDPSQLAAIVLAECFKQGGRKR